MSASVFQPFQELLEKLQEQSKDIAESLQGQDTQRPWMLPPLRGWDGDLFAITDMSKPFERDKPNEDYQDALHKDGKIGDCMTAKVQIDYLAIQERSFRMRHASFVRCAMHAAGRRRAQGTDKGVHVGSVLQYVQDLKRSGETQKT